MPVDKAWLRAHELPLLLLIRKRRRQRRLPVHRQFFRCPTFQNKHLKGFFSVMMPSMRTDAIRFFKYFRMDVTTFDDLVRIIKPHLATPRRRSSISPAEKVAVTIRYLASGDYQASLAVAFAIPYSTLTLVLHETLAAIWSALADTAFPKLNVEQFDKISTDYWLRWNFPHVCGSLDGKHVVLQKPFSSGSMYHNYKGTESIVLMALADAHYRFVYIDVGQYGGRSDGGVFENTELFRQLESGEIKLPNERSLPGSSTVASFYFLGDDAFPLRTWLLKPHSGTGLTENSRIYNYRLSRSRRCVENSFGILAARWRVFRRPIQASVKTAELITKAACCLHNFLMSSKIADTYCPTNFADADGGGLTQPGLWRSAVEGDVGLESLKRRKGHKQRDDAVSLRKKLTDFVVSPEGSAPCPWQFEYVKRGCV